MQVSKPTNLDKAWSLIQQLLKENEQLRQRVTSLEDQLKTNSKNSSKPPSSDRKGKSRMTHSRGIKKPSHPGRTRKTIDSSQMTREEIIRPTICPRCQSTKLVSERRPWFLYRWELPKLVLEGIRLRMERCRCTECGKSVRPASPKSHAMIGANLTAFILQSSSRFHLSNRKIAQLIESLSGVRFSPATIQNTLIRGSVALETAYAEVEQDSRQERIVGADETGWRTHGQRRWAWVASGKTTTLLRIEEKRNRASAERLLGKGSKQSLITDRYRAYCPRGHHQFCLAHWSRNLDKFKDKEAVQKGYETMRLDLDEVFALWKLYRKGSVSRPDFLSRVGYRRRCLGDALEYWSREGPTAQFREFCRGSLRDFKKLWTFTRVKGMEPTNNGAERDLRPLVIRRKICVGTRCDDGERFIERSYSVIQTLCKRNADVLHYLRQVMQAFWFANCAYPKLPHPACV